MAHDPLDAATPAPLWWDAVPEMTASRAPAGGDMDVDVAVVGAGYTGLWTAYELARRDPSLHIAVIEKHHVGFGASGRNGGWCYDGFAGGLDRVEAMSDFDTARDFAAAMRETVDIVGKVAADEGIGCDYHKGGTLEFLRNGGQVARAHDHVETALHYGAAPGDVRVMPAAEARQMAAVAGVHGALWSAHTAAIHPAKLAHGLAGATERRGVRIFEETPAVRIEPGRVTTPHGTVRAEVVVIATEGYTPLLTGHHRDRAPLYSLMIATEPLGDDVWDSIGLADRQTFGDLRHLVIYGQRTADGRIAFGGRGAPYDYGSRVREDAQFPPNVFAGVLDALLEILPQLDGVAITHRWGGVLGVNRTWMPTATFDRTTGIAQAGGYVGSGVAASNLAGRTLADLITGRSTRFTRFPWVNHRVRRWAPEPLRWAGINAALRVMAGADAAEERTGRRARRADWLWNVAKR